MDKSINTDGRKKTPAKILFAVVYLVGLALLLWKTNDISEILDTASSLQRGVFYIGFFGLLGVLAAIAVKTMFLKKKDELEEKPRPLWFYPLLSGVLALVVMCLAYSYLGMWPVGEESAMILDMHHQYAPLLSKMRDMYADGGNVFYAFDVGIGSSFLPMFGYYLASPFNILLCLFPENFLPEGILVITLIKNMLTASVFAVSLQYIYRRRNAAIPVVSLLYASMMYLISYSWNIMWLDAVMIAPLAVMGFEHLMRRGRYLPYVLSLAYILYVNYYIGFMICIFLVIYFIAWLLRAERTKAERIRGTIRFAIGSLIGGGLMAVMLLPIYFGLGTTSASTSNSSMPAFGANFNILDIFGRMLYNVTPTNRSGNLPNVACGLLAFLTLPLFATMKKIPLRRRMSYLGIFFVMIFSMAINYADLLWHGLHSPNDLPYRYSFLCSFIMIIMCYEVLIHLKDIGLTQVGVTAIAFAAYLFVAQRFGSQELSASTVFVSALLILIYCAVLIAVSEHIVRPKTAISLIAVVVACECVTNGANVFVSLNGQEYYTNHSAYLDNEETVLAELAVDKMNSLAESENTFCRRELLPRRTIVDSALFGYDGLSVFCSSTYYNTTRFMNSIGYQTNGVNSYQYKSFVSPTDSLLNIKYIALNADLQNHPQLINRGSVTNNGENYYIYGNPDALSLAYMTDSAVKSFSYNYYNPITTINGLYSTITGSEKSILVTSPVTTLENSLNASNTGNGFYIGEAGTARFEVTLENEGQSYIYVDCYSAKSISVTSPNLTTSVQVNEPYMLDAGNLTVGSKVSISVNCENACSGNIYVVTLDDEAYKSALSTLSDEQLEITSFSDSEIVGNITSLSDGVLMTSIPYDSGWSAEVDGKKVDCYSIMKDSEKPEADGALLALDMKAGIHDVTLTFTPKGFMPGAIVSVVSLIALIALAFVTRRRIIDEDSLSEKIELELTEPDLPEPVDEPDADDAPNDNESTDSDDEQTGQM